jgi:hypothetical protein
MKPHKKPCSTIANSDRRGFSAPLCSLSTLSILLALEASAFAETGAQSKSAPVAGGGWLVAAICYVARKKPIGGWLLYYYINLYGALAIGILFYIAFEQYSPSRWPSPGLYSLSVACALLQKLILVAQAVVATILLKRREWRWVKILCAMLIVDLVGSAIRFAVYDIYFPDKLLIACISLAWPVIWLPYFCCSRRVRRVFLQRDWGIESNTLAPKRLEKEPHPVDNQSDPSPAKPSGQTSSPVDIDQKMTEAAATIQTKLRTLDDLRGQDLISRSEYETKRKKILDQL